jgi:hypothetical protein
LAHAQPLTTTPPQTRKRKAATPSQETQTKKARKTQTPAKEQLSPRDRPLVKKAKAAALPATPITSTMDSDDDFNSVHSSEDFQDQDSEISGDEHIGESNHDLPDVDLAYLMT